jgi:hypothetical protein
VLHNDTTVIVLDWKFGGGVPVYAIYRLPDGTETMNAQIAFYACCARAGLPKAFKGRRIIGAVVQPRLEPTYTQVETDDAELDDFLVAFAGAVTEALGRKAHRERGDHCRFASCKVTCPLWTGPALDLAVLNPTMAAMRASAGGGRNEFGAFLSKALHLSELVEMWATEVRRQAHVFLEDGGQIRDWKLVAKRATRQWIDDKAVSPALTALGAEPSDIYTMPELKSVKQAEDALKKKKIKLPSELYHSVSTGTTIARSDDPRMGTDHAVAIPEFKAALKALAGNGNVPAVESGT